MTADTRDKAVVVNDPVWAVYDQLVADGTLPNRGGHPSPELADPAGRVPPGSSARIFPNMTEKDTRALCDDIFTAAQRLNRHT